MKKSPEVVLAAGLACVVIKVGTAIWRYPAISAIVFGAIFLIYVLGGPPLWEAVRSALSFVFIYAIVFIIGLACTGRKLAAFLWFIALVAVLNLFQAWIECAQSTCYYAEPSWYATTRAPNGMYVSSLNDYRWWFHRDGWLPSPATFAAVLLFSAIAILKEVVFPRLAQEVKQPIKDKTTTAGSPTDEPPMARRQQRPMKPNVADGAGTNANQSMPAGKLEDEVRALHAKIKRLQEAGKIVIVQRDKWRIRALAGEDKAAELATQLSRQPRDDRFDRLRRIVARELHPDFCTGGSVEKALRAEFFKALWPEIERLAEQGK